MVIVLIVSMSSSRFKLNRVALKELKLEPRTRRRVSKSLNEEENQLVSVKDAASIIRSHEPGQTSLICPENVTANTAEGEPEERCVGTEKNRRNGCRVKYEGPYTRGKYEQSRPNTRSKGRLLGIRELGYPRLRFPCCVYTASDTAAFNRRRVKLRRKSAKMASSRKAPKSSSMGKSVGCKNINRKCVTHVANSDVDRDSTVKARSTGCDPQPAAAAAANNTGQVQTGTPAIPTRLSDIDRNTPPSPNTGLAGSDRSLRRAVRASGCGLCGDCKYISPQQKTLCELGQKSSSPGPEQPEVEENTVTETSKKIVIRKNQIPQVTLFAKRCDALNHDCDDVFPDAHCSKQEMRAGFQYRPGCFGHGQRESEESAPAKNRDFCPRVQSERSQSLTECQRHPKGRTDVQTCHVLNSWTSEASATSSASFLLGEHTKTGECRTGRDVEDDPGPGGSRVEIHRDKRIKLKDGVKDGVLPASPDLESISCKDSAKTNSGDKEKRTSDDSQSCLERVVGGSAVRENHEEMGNPTKTDAAQMSSQTNEVDGDEIESFTCQRVIPYFRKLNFSCARTYMSWPFSNTDWKLTAHAGTTGCPAEPIDPSATSNPPLDQHQPGPTSSDMLPDAHTSGTTLQFSHRNKERQEEDGGRGLDNRNGNKSVVFVPRVMVAEVSLALDTETVSNPSQYGGETGSNTVSCSPVNRPESDSSRFAASPSAFGLIDWETPTALSPMSSPFTRGGLSSLSDTPSSLAPSSLLPKKLASTSLSYPSPNCVIKAVDKTLFHCTETQRTPWTSSSSPPHNSDSLDSCVSSLLLPQDEQESNESFTDRSPPKLEPYYTNTRHVVVNLHDILTDKCIETDLNEFLLPPVLSPVSSPQGGAQTSRPPQSSDQEEKINTRKHKMSPGCHRPQTVTGNNEKDHLEHGGEELKVSKIILRKSHFSPSNDEGDGTEEESQDETDCDDDVEQGNKTSESKIKATLTAERCSSSGSDEDDGGASSDESLLCSAGERGSSQSQTANSESDESDAEAAGDAQRGILDEFTAYEQDILLVDVIQEDPELFANLPKESLMKLGPTRVTEDSVREVSKQRLTAVSVAFPWVSPDADIKEEDNSRSWRPQCRSSNTPSIMQSNTWPATEKQTKIMGRPDANNNHVNRVLERSQPVQTVNPLHNHISPLMNIRNGPFTNSANVTDFRHQKPNTPQYCRHYFSESLICGFKVCRFQHVPMEGDEKLCIETVIRFTKNPVCLQKAGAVFTGYYQNNPPGTYFSMPVLGNLLWALLKVGMLSDVFSVLSVSLAHKIVPDHKFVLALFNIVREKGLMSVVPELLQLTFKMASAGLELDLDCLDCVKNTPEFQEAVNPNSLVSMSGNHKLSSSAPFPESLKLAHSMVEIELCTKQEDWRQMGEVFRSICQSKQHPNEVGRIRGCIAVALLSESKDKLSLPFAAFAETVCQNEVEGSLIRISLGRIGVSLMLRYHKTHQWAKGRRVVEVLSSSKVNYSTLKGLFGNEDGSSRCHLVTVATELFLLSGSLEGALNTLRENEWFLSSPSWPCKSVDLESRTRVLMRLAEKTSHRDTLEVLCNLPGLKEPNDMVDVSSYGPLFNSHLQVWGDRQILPVAADTVDFMLSKNLSVDQALLQMVLHKLGEQNHWLRAREVFRHSLSTGYYSGVSAPPGFMTLIVPCQLGEVELALALEMFITVNATDIFHLPEAATSRLHITLKRTQSSESKYLSASSRILCAASIPQPKLIINYTPVNSSQDQVFTLDVTSARSWLRCNHMWANEVWTH